MTTMPELNRRATRLAEPSGAIASLLGPDLGWPALPDMDWSRLANTQAVLVGAGAIGRPLAEHLAYLGVRRFVVIDPKRYRARSVVTQCEPHEVGKPKAAVAGQRLRTLGAEAIPLVADVGYVEPGYVDPDAIVVVSADNRRAEISANRLAAQMRVRLVKVNVEPAFLFASLRCYDLRGARPAVCLECGLTDAQYASQRPPESCDGGEDGRPSGSPRALCQIAAGVAALVVGQLAGAAGRATSRWFGRQWQLNLLTGCAASSELVSNAGCRWDHAECWRNLQRLPGSPRDLTLAALFAEASCRQPALARLRFSAGVATRARCERCNEAADVVRWCARPSDPMGVCRCGGPLSAVSFWTHTEIAADSLRAWWKRPLADWGVPPRAVLAIADQHGTQSSFVIGPRTECGERATV